MWSIFFQSTSNYHARRFGVRAAMPGFIAKRLCPQLLIVPPNFDKYRAVSREVSLSSPPALAFHSLLSPAESSPNVLARQPLALAYPFSSPPTISSACILNTELRTVPGIRPSIS